MREEGKAKVDRTQEKGGREKENHLRNADGVGGNKRDTIKAKTNTKQQSGSRPLK